MCKSTKKNGFMHFRGHNCAPRQAYYCKFNIGVSAQGLRNGPRKLVGTRGFLGSAAHAAEQRGDIGGRFALHKAPYALKVAVAAAKEADVVQTALLVKVKVN